MASKHPSVAAITLFMFVHMSLISPGTSCRYNVSKTLLDLVTMYTGNYTLEPLRATPFSYHAIIEPVDIPSLYGEVELYVKVFTDIGQVLVEQVRAFAEDADGYIVGKMYYVVSDGKEPSELTENDLQEGRDKCNMFLRQTEKDTFIVSWPNCDGLQQNEPVDLDAYYPVDTSVFTCAGQTFSLGVPKPLKVEYLRVPSRYILNAERPPLPEFLSCGAALYTSPCSLLENRVLSWAVRDYMFESGNFFPPLF